MPNPAVVRLADLRRYLDCFPDDAVVVRRVIPATMEGAYLDLDVAMTHLEQELGSSTADHDRADDDEDADEESDQLDDFDEGDQDDEDEDERILREERALREDRERIWKDM